MELKDLARSARRLRRRMFGIAGDDGEEMVSAGEPLADEAPSPAPAPPPVPLAGIEPAHYQGYVDERSIHHVHGWVRNLNDASERADVEAFLADTDEVLARGIANQYRWGLAEMGVGDGLHAYYLLFEQALAPDRVEQLRVRCTRTGHVLEISPYLVAEFNPVVFVAMDIVDNCNLRCPFCLYDYANTRATNFMTEETLDAALKFLPFTTDGNFWFSCLHEPTLHPKLMQYIDKVPQEYRRKLFYTTNLAKRMPQAYFDWLSNTGMHHINISIESLEPALYERMRKGARHRIFMENWDKLIPAFKAGANPPKIRYITMAYKSNLRELPKLVKYLIEERLAHQVELRYSFDVMHMPAEFKAAEFLEPRDWYWLHNELRDYTVEQVMLNLPPGLTLPAAGSNEIPALLTAAPEESDRPAETVMAAASAEPAEAPAEDGPADPPAASPDSEMLLGKPIDFDFPPLPEDAKDKYMRGRYEFQLASNGVLRVSRAASNHKDGDHTDGKLLTTDIRNIGDPAEFLRRLPR